MVRLHKGLIAIIALSVFLAPMLHGEEKPIRTPIILTAAEAGEYPQLWDEDELFQMPKMTPATDIDFDFDHADNVKPIYLDGIDFKGKPTRFFAWLGLPKEHVDGKVPGVVLVHGGGGTAFAQWVEEWTERGYAAIAMDTVGCRPTDRFEGVNVRTGLPGDRPGFVDYQSDIANPHDSWTAHAVATIVRSHTYLRSLPDVDPERIGITGISWGGYLTCITVAVDTRFAAAVPVYGCGFLGESFPTVKNATEDWLRLFDPCMFLKSAKCPMLFSNRPVDDCYFWESWVRSSLLPPDAVRACHVGLGHSHSAGRVREAELFLDTYCKGTPPLPHIEEQVVKNGVATARFKAFAPIERATIAWTETDKTPQCIWHEEPAGILDNTIIAAIPEKAVRFYLNLYDLRGTNVSTAGTGWK